MLPGWPGTFSFWCEGHRNAPGRNGLRTRAGGNGGADWVFLGTESPCGEAAEAWIVALEGLHEFCEKWDTEFLSGAAGAFLWINDFAEAGYDLAADAPEYVFNGVLKGAGSAFINEWGDGVEAEVFESFGGLLTDGGVAKGFHEDFEGDPGFEWVDE